MKLILDLDATLIEIILRFGIGKNSDFIFWYDAIPPMIKKNINKLAGTLFLTNQVTILFITYILD